MFRLNTLQFETDTTCNGDCTFCLHSRMQKRPQMPLWRIADLTHHLAHEAEYVYPFGMQEPLLDLRLSKTLSNVRCSNPRAKTAVYTNMSVYPREVWKEIVAWGMLDTVYISFFGGTQKLHDKMQPGAPFKQVIKNIKRLLRLRTRLGWVTPKVIMQYLVTPATLPFMKKTLRRWHQIIDDFVCVRYDSWRGLLPYNREFEEKVWGAPAPRVPCKELYRNLYVHSNGDVVPCCLDHDGEIVLGNVFTDGYDVWWRSPELQRMRTMHEQGLWSELNFCRDCTKWRYNHSLEWVSKWLKLKETRTNVVYAVNK